MNKYLIRLHLLAAWHNLIYAIRHPRYFSLFWRGVILNLKHATWNIDVFDNFTTHPRESWPGPCGTTETPND